ncbi:MAG: UbiA family prenyltransferase [Candidatus Altiarchaeota archaeon]
MDLKRTYNRFTTLLELMRIRNALIALLGVFVGAIIYAPDTPLGPVLIAGFSASLILSGGNMLNDYFDIESDKTNKPWRPIPSGRITKSDALMLGIAFFMIGIGISKAVNKYCLMIALVNTIILVVYARYSKSMLLVSNISISYLVASVFIYGALSTIVGGVFSVYSNFFLTVVVACSFLMTWAREIIKDIEDIEGDNKVYARSLPIVFGEKKSKVFATAMGVIAVLISLTPIFPQMPDFNTLPYLVVISLADLMFIASFTMHPALAQRTMVGGMTLSLIAFLSAKLISI